MSNEEKQLLLQDLCARLPYDVMVDYNGCIYILNEIDLVCKDIDYITVRIQDVERLMCAKSALIENIKPYLRSMESMTEKERCEYGLFFRYGEHDWDNYTIADEVPLVIDWLNSHYFDYRGLIEKGLAIEITKENNPYK